MTKKNLIERKGVNNADVRHYVNAKKAFKTNTESIYGVQYLAANKSMSDWNMMEGDYEQGYKPHTYVVYSYGTHFPMYVYDYEAEKWFGNIDKYSKSTTKHMGCAKPTEEIHEWYDTAMMKRIINNGYIQLLTQRLEGAPQ